MADRRARLVAASSGDAEHAAARVETVLPPPADEYADDPFLSVATSAVQWRARAHAEHELRLAAERRLERARARHGRETAVVFVLVLTGLWALVVLAAAAVYAVLRVLVG